MFRLIWIGVIVLCLIEFVSAYNLGVSPPSVDVNLTSGEKCVDFWVISRDYMGKIFVEDRWTDKNSDNILDYGKNAEDFGLKLRYDSKVDLISSKKVEICFSGGKDGDYYGLILFKTGEGSMEMASRVKVLSENSDNFIEESGFRGISGFIAFDEGSFALEDFVLVSSFGVSFGLLGFLIYLIRIRGKRTKEDY